MNNPCKNLANYISRWGILKGEKREFSPLSLSRAFALAKHLNSNKISALLMVLGLSITLPAGAQNYARNYASTDSSTFVSVPVPASTSASSGFASSAQNATPGAPVISADSTSLRPENPGPMMMTTDLVIVRPTLFLATVVGTTFFVLSYPFTYLGGNTQQAAQKLVLDPAYATFKRCLGCGGGQTGTEQW